MIARPQHGRDHRQPERVAVPDQGRQRADLQQQVQDADANRRTSTASSPCAGTGSCRCRRRCRGRECAMNRTRFGSHSCLSSVQRKARLPTGKSSQWPLVLQLRHVRVALGVVDELMVGQVLQAIVVRAAVKREHAEQVGGQVVEPAIAKQDVMNRLMGQAAQLVLAGPDQEDREQPDRHVPPKRPPHRRAVEVEPDGSADHGREDRDTREPEKEGS